MFKKIASGFMLSFLCFVQLSCCTVNHYKTSSDLYVSYLNQKFNKTKSVAKNQNFIFLSKYIMSKDNNDFTKICDKEEDEYSECNDPLIPINSASGYVVSTDKNTGYVYALTAAHWCEENTKDELYDSTELLFENMPIVGYYASFMGKQYKIRRYIMDYTSDLCMVVFISKYSNYAKKTKIASEDPKIGDKVIAISAPMWSYEEEYRQHYIGLASGCDDFECAFTLPATYGSSGSAVINEKGEIVSIISRAAVSFNHYILGTKPEKINEFLENAYETLRR